VVQVRQVPLYSCTEENKDECMQVQMLPQVRLTC
jgi:hypothetical protein